MEVHHPHHITHKKQWKEYLIEFIMLFTAVTLGFFAENYRERVIESHKEKEYMQTMVVDLKEDIDRIQNSIETTSMKVQAMDSLIRNIYAKPYTDSSIRRLYYLYRRYMGSATDVSFSRRTINQLINSGNLRLIRSMEISDSIVYYDINTDRIVRQYSVFHDQYQQKARELSNQIFDSYYLVDYDRRTVQGLLKTNKKLDLLNNEEKLLKEYANIVYGGKGVLTIYVQILQRHKLLANNIMQQLSKEYSIQL
jgi:hypothetical protein